MVNITSLSHVVCHISCVKCNYFLFFFLSQSVGAIQWRVCYQRGLPRLVYEDLLVGSSQSDRLTVYPLNCPTILPS